MSNYDEGDVLVPPGVRYLTRPGVTYVTPSPSAPTPASPPHQPPVASPSKPGLPVSRPAPTKHPVQPKPAAHTHRSPLEHAASYVVIDPRLVYHPAAFTSPASAGPNTALATASNRNVGQVARPARSLSALTPTSQRAPVHLAQPVTPASRQAQHSQLPGAAAHRARHAADVIAEHLEAAHHVQHAYERGKKVEDFLKPQRVLDRDADQRMRLREEIARPPLRSSEPTRPIWGDLGSLAEGRVEFDY